MGVWGWRRGENAQTRQWPLLTWAETSRPSRHRQGLAGLACQSLGLPHWPRASKGHAAPTWQRLKMSEWVTRTLKCLITAVACCRALREQSTERQRPAPTWARSCGHMQPSSGGPEPRAHPGPAFPAPGREPPLCPGWGSGAAQPPSPWPHDKQTLRCGRLRKSRLRCESSVGSSPCGTAALRSG